jgi:uncharacterized protein YqgC (DUF456 family)
MADTPFSVAQPKKKTPFTVAPKQPKIIQAGAVKKATASIDALMHNGMKTAGATQDAALGALMGVLFGRMVNIVPGLNKLVAGGIPRDALIGALAASATSHLASTDPTTTDMLSHTPDTPMSKLV